MRRDSVSLLINMSRGMWQRAMLPSVRKCPCVKKPTIVYLQVLLNKISNLSILECIRALHSCQTDP